MQKKVQVTETRRRGYYKDRRRRFFITLTGRSNYYSTPTSFIEEALRLGGTSRKTPGIVAYPNDVVLFATAPQQRLKRDPSSTFHPLIFGYGIVKGYAIYPQTELARRALNQTITTLLQSGVATNVVEVGEVVERLCGRYQVGRRVEIKDWTRFVDELHKQWRTLAKQETDTFNILSVFDFLMQTDFHPIDPYLPCPFPIKFVRFPRIIKLHELELLLSALKERLSEATIDAFFDERPDQPAILLELTEYIQQAMASRQPMKGKQQRKVKQPTPIPEPEISEPEPPKPEVPKPLIDFQSKPSQCIHCGAQTEGAILCPQCRAKVLNRIKELKAEV